MREEYLWLGCSLYVDSVQSGLGTKLSYPESHLTGTTEKGATRVTMLNKRLVAVTLLTDDNGFAYDDITPESLAQITLKTTDGTELMQYAFLLWGFEIMFANGTISPNIYPYQKGITLFFLQPDDVLVENLTLSVVEMELDEAAASNQAQP